MAETTINVPANTTSAAIPVTPLKPLGVDADNPVIITSKYGSKIFPSNRFVGAGVIVPPNDEIFIEAGEEAAVVILEDGV